MVQEILAQTIVFSASAYAVYAIIKTMLPVFRKESSCNTGACNCPSVVKNVKDVKLSVKTIKQL
jgi:hypothetical protein